MRSNGCGWCGNPGHGEESCEIKRRDQRRTAFNSRPVKPRAVSDPADRDAGPNTMFLIPEREP